MEERIKNKFKRKVIEASANRYGCMYHNLELIGNHQHYVYKVKKNNGYIFIRITHQSHRQWKDISAEINWIKHLSSKGINVAMPIYSYNNLVIETIHDEDEIFYVVAFKEAKGKGIGQYPWNFKIPYTLGKLTAHMHVIAKDYIPIHTNKRYNWDKNNFINNASDYLPDNQFKVIEELNSLVAQIKVLPKYRDSFGLIHGDLVACNYHFDGNRITLFDFDESCYCWFINDIAIQLFYWSLTYRGHIDKEGAYTCAMHFLEGYRKVNSIEAFWLKQIPLFIKLREIVLYIAIYRSRNLNDLDEWSMNFMKDRRKKIEDKTPFIDIDFSIL